eukprot:gene823-3076_t
MAAAGGGRGLTDEEVRHYHEHGYVIPAGFRLDEQALARIREDHTRLLSRTNGALLPHDLGFANHARNEAVLDMVEQLIGPDVGLWNMSFFAKPARTGREVPWHQDGDYC